MLYDRELHEECGVFGVFNLANASELTYYGLHALQHRGQEGAGIVVSDGEKLNSVKNEGSVRFVFPESVLKKLQGNMAIGHVRYSTTGGGGILNVQPFLFRHGEGDFALCHNGNIVNSKELRRNLEMKGSIFQSSSDSEILAHLDQERLSQYAAGCAERSADLSGRRVCVFSADQRQTLRHARPSRTTSAFHREIGQRLCGDQRNLCLGCGRGDLREGHRTR
jgi:glutamine phosphoribosylpyrophosphate amidotransferase